MLMERFYKNLLGKRVGLSKPMAKAAALAEAKAWLRSLSREEKKTSEENIPKVERTAIRLCRATHTTCYVHTSHRDGEMQVISSYVIPIE